MVIVSPGEVPGLRERPKAVDRLEQSDREESSVSGWILLPASGRTRLKAGEYLAPLLLVFGFSKKTAAMQRFEFLQAVLRGCPGVVKTWTLADGLQASRMITDFGSG